MVAADSTAVVKAGFDLNGVDKSGAKLGVGAQRGKPEKCQEQVKGEYGPNVVSCSGRRCLFCDEDVANGDPGEYALVVYVNRVSYNVAAGGRGSLTHATAKPLGAIAYPWIKTPAIITIKKLTTIWKARTTTTHTGVAWTYWPASSGITIGAVYDC